MQWSPFPPVEWYLFDAIVEVSAAILDIVSPSVGEVFALPDIFLVIPNSRVIKYTIFTLTII